MTKQNNGEGTKVGGKKNESGNKTQEAQGWSTRSSERARRTVSKKTNYSSASEFDSDDGDDENDKIRTTTPRCHPPLFPTQWMLTK